MRLSGRSQGTYIVMFVFWEQREPLLQEDNKLLGHLVELADVAVCVDVAETGADGVVNKHDVGKLVPRSFVVHQRLVVLEPVGANFHEGAILRAAPRAAIEPNDGSLLVGDVLVLKVPEEEVSVVFGGDFDVATQRSCQHVSDVFDRARTYPACIFNRGPGGAPGRE